MSVIFASELPTHIQENLIAGVLPHQKRVVLNLASVSRIKNDDGTVRTYDDFMSDWEYTGSTFVIKGTCFLCGKHPIREACHVQDKETGREIVVGNECVYKHIEIITEGIVGLTGDAKRDFLRLEMGKAKARFFKADWSDKYDLSRWSDITAFFDTQPKWRTKSYVNTGNLSRARRMIKKKGYIAPNTKTFEWFDEQWPLWDGVIDKIKDSMKARLARRETRTAEWITIRNKRNADATAFRNIAEQKIESGELDNSFAVKISATEYFIRNNGLMSFHRAGYAIKNCYDAVMRYSDTHKPINTDNLSQWEKEFLASIEEWTGRGKEMTEKQKVCYEKIMKKVE